MGKVFEIFDGIEGKDDKPRRGNSYYFEYKFELDSDGDGQVDTMYPYEYDNIRLLSTVQTPLKQQPKILIYPSTSSESTATFKYTCSDIDSALVEKNINASNGEVNKVKPIEVGNYSDFKEVTFDGLSQGNLILNVYQKSKNNGDFEKRTLISQYFEGVRNIDDLTYNVTVDGNKVKVTLSDSANIDRVAAFYIEYQSVNNPSKKYTTRLLTHKNGILTTNLNEISDFLDEPVSVNVYAYFDDVKNRIDINNDYYTLQKAYLSDEYIYYYYLNENGDLTYYPSATGNIYSINKLDNNINVTNAMYNKLTNDFALDLTDKGYIYNNDPIIQKPLSLATLKNTNDNTIKFDVIIPGIRMQNEAGDLNIERQLDLVRISPKLTVNPNISLQDDKIYIELYKTDSNWKNPQYIKTIEKTVDEFEDPITIDGLEAKSYYYIRFKTNIIKSDGSIVEKYLYDIDQEIEGRIYYFNTLADVKVSNVQVKYNPLSYSKKTVDVIYTLDIILGYQKIRYTLYEYNKETKQYDEIYVTEDSEPFTTDMVKQIEANPGSMFKFGEKYKIKIDTIAVYDNNRELEISSYEHEFNLASLSEPIVAMKAVRRGNNIIDFKTTIYDQANRVVKDDKYTLAILNDKREDITPENAKVEFSTDLINNTITVNEIDPTKKYILQVFLNLDLSNDGQNFVQVIKEFELAPINEYGITLGNVSAVANNDKVDIIFNESYNLTSIEQVRYTVYNINGYAKSGVVEFKPKRVQTGEDFYYTFTIEEYLEDAGVYYIELQFLKEGKIVESSSLEYIYTK